MKYFKSYNFSFFKFIVIQFSILSFFCFKDSSISVTLMSIKLYEPVLNGIKFILICRLPFATKKV